MATTTMALPPRERGGVPTIVTAWLALGVVDALSAIVISMARAPTGTAERTFQGVAFALLGKDAFDGGAATALFGLALHFTVALIWASVYYFASRKVPAILRVARSPWGIAKIGVPFGAVIWLTMNFIVFPNTRIAHHVSVDSASFWINFIHHMVMLGPLVVAIER